MKQLLTTRSFQRGASILALALAPSLGLSPAQAQPDINNGAKAENPTNRPVGVPLTAEQRLSQRLRVQLQVLGTNDLATQDKLLKYVETENAARTALLEKAQQLQQGLRGNVLSDAQVAALLNDYQAAIEEDKTRRAKAEEALKKDYDLSKNPKIESLLVLLGVYGDGPVLSGGNMATMGNPRVRNPRGGVNPRQAPNTNPFLNPNPFGGNTGRQRNNGTPTQPNIRPQGGAAV